MKMLQWLAPPLPAALITKPPSPSSGRAARAGPPAGLLGPMLEVGLPLRAQGARRIQVHPPDSLDQFSKPTCVIGAVPPKSAPLVGES